jgi:hypothetical protein
LRGRIIVASLKEFLSEQAEKLKAEKSDAAKKRDEWVGAVDRLNDEIRGWLGQADPSHILEIHVQSYHLREVGIGAYDVDGLTICLGKTEVRTQPIARNVVGPHSATGVIEIKQAYGRVDLTDGLRKYMIFRVDREPDRWTIIAQDDFRALPFNQQTLERAFQSLVE